MIIRLAEPRDISTIEDMFHQLLEHLRGCGQKYYQQDSVTLRNGVMGFIIGKMYDENSVIYVSENKDGQVQGFLIGGIVYYPIFFQHEKLGEIQWMDRLSLISNPTYSRQMSRAFEIWARSKGCTAGSNYCLPGNIQAQKLMKHDGRDHVFNYYIKPYPALEGNHD